MTKGTIMATEAVKTHIETLDIDCRLDTATNGEPYLDLNGRGYFPSLPSVQFGLRLKWGTTRAQAEALAAQIREHCPEMFYQWCDQELDGLPVYEHDEDGWAITDRPGSTV
jgi:hypothetical protein